MDAPEARQCWMSVLARMGGTGRRFILGDATVTRAVIRLDDGTCGYSYILG
nr:phosphonate C-P lyase system protein PhnG [Sodalis glossinidius]